MTIDLTRDERTVLRCGLAEWGGPAACTDALAVAMGFQDVPDLFEQAKRLRATLADEEPLRASEWRKTLIATEIVFASDVFGSGMDWSITTGFADEETLPILRDLQRKIARALGSAHYRPGPPERL
ncbi:hypothetical protein [Amycolatopsis regifaucium]|uniref:Uncharacterized protein n=1 Tax=Amycolatopsis regifaucium TaxID=546365 RepID=A0A154MBY9_9PSEU|nr:hypothetical protein [Amycolatopsis regifaucium]KZB82128.1 hypothetical protein AVL48_09300 [Amycolatopsis regifaucium]OKA05801.1 hypothetical protein ATP06_0221690 [Amycolatopsis regifaucium]SFG83483.1 hypothetical protein SAMN04489731_101641 [Amycolatopsis regifaucium]